MIRALLDCVARYKFIYAMHVCMMMMMLQPLV